MVSTRGRSRLAGQNSPQRKPAVSPAFKTKKRKKAAKVAAPKCLWDVLRLKGETHSLRERYIGPSCQLFFRKDPLKIVRGRMQYMYEQDGTQYLDCINNVAHVGHCHPYVVQAGSKQMATLQTNNRYLHDHIVTLAQRLCSTLPSELSVCFFVNSGSEANDLAQRMAFYYTKNKDAICLENAYHGHIKSCIEISPYKFNHPGSDEKKPDNVHVVATPDRYRGKYRDNEYSLEQLTDLYVGEVQRICDQVNGEGRGLGFFIAESLQSCGGQVLPPPGYLRRVYELVRSAGGVCIADEVQTGFGRIGSGWWAFQMGDNDVVPDIVTMGKPMGNGHPISAVFTTPAIARAFRRGPDYFNTYGGNPVSCAIGLAVLDVIEHDRLMENAVTTGQLLEEKLRQLQEKHELIGDVRGAGFFLGIDLVLDRKERIPATELAEIVLWSLRSKNIIMSLDGPHENILKFKPPMCFNKSDVDRLVAGLDCALTEVEAQLAAVAAAAAGKSSSSIAKDN